MLKVDFFVIYLFEKHILEYFHDNLIFIVYSIYILFFLIIYHYYSRSIVYNCV